MKILVCGAGVLGTLYAARLKASGRQVSILARGERLEQIRRDGLLLEDARSGQQAAVPIDAVTELAPGDDYDLVIVLVRREQVAALLPLLSRNTRIPGFLFMVNNVMGPGEYIAALGKERILLGFAGASGQRLGDGRVRYTVLPGFLQTTSVGELDGRQTPRIRRIAAALEDAGFSTTIRPQMDAWLKTHVALVSPLANAILMAGGDNHRLAAGRSSLALLLQAIREGLKVLQALDVPITPPGYAALKWMPDFLLLPLVRAALKNPQSELILTAHTLSARVEMEKISGEFRRLARSAAVPVPAIDRLYEAAFSTPAGPAQSSTAISHR